MGMTCPPATSTRLFHLNRCLDKAPGGAPGGAKKGKAAAGGKVTLEVETDPYKLQKYCCGSNYFLEGEDVELKPDSEYPDWLWKMDIKRPTQRPTKWNQALLSTINKSKRKIGS